MAEQKRDYYEVLGVDKGADDAAIKKATDRAGFYIPFWTAPSQTCENGAVNDTVFLFIFTPFDNCA